MAKRKEGRAARTPAVRKPRSAAGGVGRARKQGRRGGQRAGEKEMGVYRESYEEKGGRGPGRLAGGARAAAPARARTPGGDQGRTDHGGFGRGRQEGSRRRVSAGAGSEARAGAYGGRSGRELSGHAREDAHARLDRFVAARPQRRGEG